jgi:hypothetical protein
MGGYVSDLGDLKWHWSGAYNIAYFARPGLWLAQRRDTHETVKAEDPEELRDLIRADYFRRPVRRAARP